MYAPAKWLFSLEAVSWDIFSVLLVSSSINSHLEAVRTGINFDEFTFSKGRRNSLVVFDSSTHSLLTTNGKPLVVKFEV